MINLMSFWSNIPWYINFIFIILITFVAILLFALYEYIKRKIYKKKIDNKKEEADAVKMGNANFDDIKEYDKNSINNRRIILDEEKKEINTAKKSDTNFNYIKEHNKNLNSSNSNNSSLFGIYNTSFRSKNSINYRQLVLVEEKKDSCRLCRPFENQILSLAKYDNKYITMNEAISKGYHHLGCKHIDNKYFVGQSIIPQNQFSDDIKEKNFDFKKQQFFFENKIRKIKFLIKQGDNKNRQELLTKLTLAESEYNDFLNINNLMRNASREKFNVSDIERFS